ncbi:BQ2448_7157 [Microbotryum intermedium]|uniref:BQ2448_7157 protein n=1 Tax=Microbotryum intermedium TaxID=269621 RepID=A0A238FHE6_9BASI|nr:BQ2448_7157 [Microbotryum intermedium]
MTMPLPLATRSLPDLSQPLQDDEHELGYSEEESEADQLYSDPIAPPSPPLPSPPLDDHDDHDEDNGSKRSSKHSHSSPKRRPRTHSQSSKTYSSPRSYASARTQRHELNLEQPVSDDDDAATLGDTSSILPTTSRPPEHESVPNSTTTFYFDALLDQQQQDHHRPSLKSYPIGTSIHDRSSRADAPQLDHHDASSIHSAPELDYHDASYMNDDSRVDHSPGAGAGDGDGDDLDSPGAESPLSPDTPTAGSSYGGDRRRGSRSEVFHRLLPYTLWDYLQEEVLSVEVDGEQGVKSERVTNFLTVPGELERIIIFGVIICFDSFLYIFTILPLRTLVAVYTFILNTVINLHLSVLHRSQPRRRMRLSHKCDLAKATISVLAMIALHRITDASKMYHSVRGQDTIKLYVLFNVLEIADRLCCSFGQDLQDSLFSQQTLSRRTDGSHPHIRPLALFGLTVVYIVAHTLVLFYQLVTLNVAINSYSNALLTLLLSNQFVEIKGSVFKKFEKENLFQLTCADVVERFQLGIMLFIIALRNLIELSSTAATPLFPLLASFPSSLSKLPTPSSLALLQTIFSPAIVVLMSECFVDWLKHAFITKFNHIRPQVYGRFIDVLCKDLIVGAKGTRREQPFVDQSPVVARRLGFAALPLGCLVVRVIAQAFEMLVDDSAIDECAMPSSKLMNSAGGGVLRGGGAQEGWGDLRGWAVVGLVVLIGWICLVALKLLIGINLRAFASERWSSMQQREIEDQLNDRGRAKIGVTQEEASMDKQVERLLKDDIFDANERGRKISLASLSRYDMIRSRLW